MSSPAELLQQQLQAAQQQTLAIQQAADAEVNNLRAQLAAARSANSSLSAASSSSSPAGHGPGGHQHQGSPSFRIDIKAMQPSAFHGSASNSADQWLMEVERYFAAVGLEEASARRAAFASTYLKDAASTWYTSMLKEPEFGPTPSWTVFKERFLQRFRPLAASRMARAAIRSMKQRVKVAGYSQEFQKHMQVIPDMSMADQVESYISGLHSYIALEVDREQPQTLSEAMELAQRIELMHATRRGGNHSFGRSMPYHRGGGGGYGHHSGGDQMDLSALFQGDEAPDVGYGENAAFEYLNAMFQRGRGGHQGGGGGGRNYRGGRGGGRGGGHVPGLSQADFDKLSKEGKCFKCREAGHLARNCPKAGADGSKNS